MESYTWRATLCALVIVLAAVPAVAQQLDPARPGCLERAEEKLDSGDWVSVVAKTSEITTAHLVSLEPGRSLISVSTSRDGVSSTLEFTESEITAIRYHRTGKLRPSYMILGTIIGGVAGAIIGKATDPNCDGEGLCFEFGGAAGFVIGAAGGLVGGTVLSVASPATETIRCEN